MHWHARSRRLSRPRRATPAGQDAVGDRADRVLSPPPVPGTTTSTGALRRVFAGRADQVRHARRFVKAALAEGCPLADLVVLLSDELVTNAVVHTRSGDGGRGSGMERAVIGMRGGARRRLRRQAVTG